MKKNLQPLAAIMLAATAELALPCFAAEWEKPWSSVQAEAVKRCAKIFDSFQIQAVCMENEKEGYDKMQGNFRMPSDVAGKAKERCEKVFDAFQMQAVCMENEKAGYDKMKQY